MAIVTHQPALKAYLAPLSKDFISITGDPGTVSGIARNFSAVFFKGLPAGSNSGTLSSSTLRRSLSLEMLKADCHARSTMHPSEFMSQTSSLDAHGAVEGSESSLLVTQVITSNGTRLESRVRSMMVIRKSGLFLRVTSHDHKSTTSSTLRSAADTRLPASGDFRAFSNASHTTSCAAWATLPGRISSNCRDRSTLAAHRTGKGVRAAWVPSRPRSGQEEGGKRMSGARTSSPSPQRRIGHNII